MRQGLASALALACGLALAWALALALALALAWALALATALGLALDAIQLPDDIAHISGVRWLEPLIVHGMTWNNNNHSTSYNTANDYSDYMHCAHQ